MKELLLKYINGDCTDQEKVKITNWLDSNPANMKEYLALRKLNDITIWQTNPDVKQQQTAKEKVFIWSWNKYYTEILKIAAVFLIGILVSRYFLSDVISQSPSIAMQTLYVPAGQRAELTLEDGTRVWLNAKTTLTFPNHFSEKTREVRLDGEGFFDVTSSKAKPFIVNTGKYNIKVWGTTFNLMAYSGSETFETSLLEGSVEILKPGYDNGVMLKPNEQLFFRAGNMVIAPIKNMDHFLWKEGVISFDNETFTELVKKLELYFDLDIDLKNEKILNYRCTGKFRMRDGVEHILKVLQLSNHFTYHIDNKQNKIIIE